MGEAGKDLVRLGVRTTWAEVRGAVWSSVEQGPRGRRCGERCGLRWRRVLVGGGAGNGVVCGGGGSSWAEVRGTVWFVVEWSP